MSGAAFRRPEREGYATGRWAEERPLRDEGSGAFEPWGRAGIGDFLEHGAEVSEVAGSAAGEAAGAAGGKA